MHGFLSFYPVQQGFNSANVYSLPIVCHILFVVLGYVSEQYRQKNLCPHGANILMERRNTANLVIKLLNRWRKEKVEQVRGWGQPGEGAEGRLQIAWGGQ